jgi:hypothetical protein
VVQLGLPLYPVVTKQRIKSNISLPPVLPIAKANFRTQSPLVYWILSGNQDNPLWHPVAPGAVGPAVNTQGFYYVQRALGDAAALRMLPLSLS